MDLKFYLNKFLKVDNVEGYTIPALEELRKSYDRFLEKAGFDPDFPMLSFGAEEDKKKSNGGRDRLKFEKNKNIYTHQRDGESIEQTKSRLSLGEGFSELPEDLGNLTLRK
jgi:hypothetical protein